MLEFNDFITLLKREVKPALGCTEPVAVSLAVARAKEELRNQPIDTVEVQVSANILKNGMGVGIPGVGMVGLHIAAALGAICGKSCYKLEVLREICTQTIETAKQMVEQGRVDIKLADTEKKLYVKAICRAGNQTGVAVIEDVHDNITLVQLNGRNQFNVCDNGYQADRSATEPLTGLTVQMIYDFAMNVPFQDIEFILQAATMNKRIAEEGFANDYGLQVGKTIRKNMNQNIFGNGILTYSMALTAAASDARMAGSILPAMSNSGSGNQGITATLPVVAAAEKLNASTEQLARALIISHLVSIHIKQSLGRLSALCGCVVASSGSSCGIVYLLGGGYDQMTYAIKNMIGNVTGMVCDGAKVGCALKVSSGVSAAVQSAILGVQNISVSDSEGIIESDIEKTIFNLSTIGTAGMATTDDIMLDIMVNKKKSHIRCL